MTMFSLEMCHMYVVAKTRGRGRGKRKRPHTDQYEGGYCLRRHQRITAKKDR